MNCCSFHSVLSLAHLLSCFPERSPWQGSTAHKISKHITFLANDVAGTPMASVSPAQPKPILLMLPWLGSKPQAIAKYCEIYFRTGFDVLIVESEVRQFLWPRWGLEYGGHVLELLESERFSQRPLLVHAFSIGGYTFAQVLVHVAKDTQRYQGLTNRIRGHIYDSLVMGSLEHMANGMYIDCSVKCVHLYIQCLPLILAPLVNMSKGGCENKSALFILFIFHSNFFENSNLSLK